MNREEVLQKIKNLNIWKKRDQRAPHKPLLILYALGQLQAKQQMHLPYREVKIPLKELLMEFGPSRSSYASFCSFDRRWNMGAKRRS